MSRAVLTHPVTKPETVHHFLLNLWSTFSRRNPLRMRQGSLPRPVTKPGIVHHFLLILWSTISRRNPLRMRQAVRTAPCHKTRNCPSLLAKSLVHYFQEKSIKNESSGPYSALSQNQKLSIISCLFCGPLFPGEIH